MSDQQAQALSLWKDTCRRLLENSKNLLEKCQKIQSSFPLLRLIHLARTDVHRAKGIAGLASCSEILPWLDETETKLASFCLARSPFEQKTLFENLLKNTEKGMATILEDKEFPQDLWPKGPAENELFPPGGEELITLVGNHLPKLPWKEELPQRLDPIKRNLLRIALEDGQGFLALHFNIPSDQLLQLQEWNDQDREWVLLDLWPRIEKNQVEVRSLFLGTGQALMGIMKNPLLPQDAWSEVFLP